MTSEQYAFLDLFLIFLHFSLILDTHHNQKELYNYK